MEKRTIPWSRLLAFLSLFIAALMFAHPGYTQPQDPITATHTYDAKTGKVTFCITVQPERSNQIYGVEFLGSWAPLLGTPLDQFEAPQGWSWEPVSSGGWRAYNPAGPML